MCTPSKAKMIKISKMTDKAKTFWRFAHSLLLKTMKKQVLRKKGNHKVNSTPLFSDRLKSKWKRLIRLPEMLVCQILTLLAQSIIIPICWLGFKKAETIKECRLVILLKILRKRIWSMIKNIYRMKIIFISPLKKVPLKIFQTWKIRISSVYWIWII